MRDFYVITKSGDIEFADLNKILQRLKRLARDLDVSVTDIARDTITGIRSGITTAEIDEISERLCAARVVEHPDYDRLAARLAVDRIHRAVSADVAVVYDRLERAGRVSREFAAFTRANAVAANAAVAAEYPRESEFQYIAISTMEKSYLLQIYDTPRLPPAHRFADMQREFLAGHADYRARSDTLRAAVAERARAAVDALHEASDADSAVAADPAGAAEAARSRRASASSDVLACDTDIDTLVDTFVAMITARERRDVAERPAQMFWRVAAHLAIANAANFEPLMRSVFERPGLPVRRDPELRRRDTGLVAQLARRVRADAERLAQPGDAVAMIAPVMRLMSRRHATFATPTLFNSGTRIPQTASCFLMDCADSTVAIDNDASNCKFISRYGGGIGICMSRIRASGTEIAGTGGRRRDRCRG